MNLIKLAIALLIILSLTACSDVKDEANSSMTIATYSGDSMLNVTVVNLWQAGPKTIIQVKRKEVFFEIENLYFGGLNPRIGDCVMVWASIYSDGHPFYNREVLHLNRDIAPCEK